MMKRKGDPCSKEAKVMDNKSSKVKKKKKKHGSSRQGELRIRSVSELAELVTSGTVRVPKSLVEYVDDSVQLLDQVFTILSPTDIKGMLPDILKGLKMKRVKQLCYEQLKTMSTEQITDVIQMKSSVEENTKVSTSLSSVSHDIDSIISKPSTTPSPSIAENTELMSDSSIHYSTFNLPDKDSLSTSTNLNSLQSDDMTMSCDVIESSAHTASISKTSKLFAAPGESDEFVISISDVSDTEDSLDKELTNHHQDSELNQPSNAQYIEETYSDSSSGTELEGEDDISVIPEANQLLEMEFRRRALEAELQRINDTSNEGGSTSVIESGTASKHIQSQDLLSHLIGTNTSSTIEGSVDGSKPMQVDGSCTDEGIDASSVIEMDFGTLLEMKLREKALQSLLTKRKKS